MSDSHINSKNNVLPKIIDEIFKNVDLVIHTGDICHISIIKNLEKKYKVLTVQGNMDNPYIKYSYPELIFLNIENPSGKFTFAVTHGHKAPFPPDQSLPSFFKTKVDCIVFGHTHKTMNEYHRGILMFNPGSIHSNRNSDYNSVGIIKINEIIEGEIHNI